MSTETPYPNAPLLSALSFISSRPHHYYSSPKVQPKRASVALILWIKPPQGYSLSGSDSQGAHQLVQEGSII